MAPTTRTGVRVAAVFAAAALMFGGTASAFADSTDDLERARAAAAAAAADVQTMQGQSSTAASQLGQAQADLQESSTAVAAATRKLAESQSNLQAAKQALAVAETDLKAAERNDAEMAAKLDQTVLLLAASDSLVAKNQAVLDAERSKAGEIARSEYQNNSPLVGVATLLTTTTTAELSSRMQFTNTMLDTTAAQMTRLQDKQAQLAAAKTDRAVLQAQADFAKKQAAAQVSATQKARDAAAAAKAKVAAAVAANAQAQEDAEMAYESDAAAVAAKQAEIADVNSRIQKRLADQRAAEGAASAAEKRIAEEKAAAERAAAAAKASGGSGAPAPAPAPAVSSRGLVRPVSGPVTSSYGMRFHPVLRVWKLHDGMDFGGGCGTPIRAAASGVVAERYFNVGYGNRLFIDHGKVNGTYLTTAYNHLSSYAVSPGQSVTRGQVIGYVGTTGYSTGCHLHFMVWANGNLVNPASYV